MVADVMQVMNNTKCGIYSFYGRLNLTVGFLRYCTQYGHYFIRQLSAATYIYTHMSVCVCVCVCTVNVVFIYRASKSNGFLFNVGGE